ncbi:Internalin-A precursor [Allorhodopirellula heiligendammensis]|uniref:Internalin-A n=1 Tax=Allorhodopirellula heiligendammensis TaxID=2714739 RepID=A0A5C6BFV3_9BACT|nr:Internalin-A precursor [Allorhodopirellula heiligendammensis]
MVSLVFRLSTLSFAVAAFVCSMSHTSNPALAQTPESGSIFTDPALEAAVRAHVFAKRHGNEPLTVDDVAEISRVVAPQQGIRSLEGLQHCRSLMLVDLAGNEISDLAPLAKLNKLQSVTLAGNRIESIAALEPLTRIQLLDLSGNDVAQLEPIRNMKNMRTLYLADNQLENISAIAELQKISALDLAGNPIVDLSPVSSLGWLTTLEISDCQVRSLSPLGNLTKLAMLIMPNNPIDSLDPILKMCVEDAGSNRRFAPYLKIYLDLQSDKASAWQGAIEKLKAVGVSVHDYRRPTTSKSTHSP